MDEQRLLDRVRRLRQTHQQEFRLNALGQIGTCDDRFRDPLAFAVDPRGFTTELTVIEYAVLLAVPPRVVEDVLLVCDGCECALRDQLLAACGLTG
jgi:hypothetical protein